MSIATMKRKSKVLNGNISSGGHFSLSGVSQRTSRVQCNVFKKMVKYDYNNEYINEKKLKSIDCPTTTISDDVCKTATKNIGGRMIQIGTIHKDMNSVKNEAGEYTKTTLLKNNCLPTPDCMKPFPIAINKGVGCYDRYETPQDAIDAGLLPSNWGNC